VIPSDRNVIKKEAVNKLKHKNLRIEIQRMWNVKCFVISVIIGAKGTVSISLKLSGNNTRTTFNRFSTKKKTAIRGTSHIIINVLQSET
jgi:hypothetical protein